MRMASRDRAAVVPAALAMFSLFLAAPPARAQVSDSERAAARELFKDGDQLQRAGHFADALDKFQRAQQVFAAPTNVLRIAECQAALGHLVASAEAYRDVLRTPLSANAPPAFQSAVDQAKAELSQVDPRVPKVIVQVTRGPSAGARPVAPSQMQLQVDGQPMSGALIGEPIPLDPGEHKVTVIAAGYTSPETRVDLAEHETKTVSVSLAPAAGISISPGSPAAPALPLPPPPAGSPGPDTPPPPPPIVEEGVGPSAPLRSSASLLLGGHLGLAFAAGKILDSDTNRFIDASSVSSAGVAIGADVGLRFARQWYLGLSLGVATLGSSSNVGLSDVSRASSKTEQADVILGLMVNPDRASFYGEVGLGGRWLQVHETKSTGGTTDFSDSSPELVVGAGIWIPASRGLRVLPKATFGVASFASSADATTSNSTASGAGDARNSALATFVMLGCAGFYNLDL